MTYRLERGFAAGLLMAVGIILTSATCGGVDGEPERTSSAAQTASQPRFDGAAAYQLVERQLAFGPRVPGTAGHRAMAEWLETYLSERADTLIVQRFEHATVTGETIQLFNYLARFRPDEGAALLLLAHWDTRPVSDAASDPDERTRPVPGANDGASGTAILLQLAEMFRQAAPARGVDILLVDGEDFGDFAVGKDVFLGSRHFAANLPEGYSAEFGILLDMVGDRNLEIFVEGNSNRLAPAIVDRVWNVAAGMGFSDIFRRQVRHTVNDDHIPINDAGIPTINIIDFDYPYWHTPNDTLDKVSASSLAVVGAVISRIAYGGG